MSRVGIVTFHRAENFGAVMQSYALQTVIERLGHEAVIIDYRNKTIERNYHILNPAILLSRKNIIASISQYLYRFKNLKQRYLKKSIIVISDNNTYTVSRLKSSVISNV